MRTDCMNMEWELSHAEKYLYWVSVVWMNSLRHSAANENNFITWQFWILVGIIAIKSLSGGGSHLLILKYSSGFKCSTVIQPWKSNRFLYENTYALLGSSRCDVKCTTVGVKWPAEYRAVNLVYLGSNWKIKVTYICANILFITEFTYLCQKKTPKKTQINKHSPTYTLICLL